MGITPQTPAVKKYPHGDKGKESRTHHGFYKLVMVLLRFPAAEHIYCEGEGTNNRVASAPTVSKMLFRELQLNLSAPRCQRDRLDVFRDFPRGEISWPHISLIGKRSPGASVKAYSAWKNVSVIYLITLKWGSRFVCCDNVC